MSLFRSFRVGRTLLVFIVGLAPLFVIAARADDAEDVRAADLNRIRALIHADRAALEAVLADELTYGHSDGRRQTKAELLNAVAAGAITYQSYDGPRPEVRVYGDVGVMSGVAELRATAGETAVKFRIRYLAVYAKRGDAWRLVAYQSASLEQPSAAK